MILPLFSFVVIVSLWASWMFVTGGLHSDLVTQCNLTCEKDLRWNRRNTPLITFCQLWVTEEMLIDPAVELGIQLLQQTFGERVEFQWVKATLPGSCTDETVLETSPAAVNLHMMKSNNGCTLFLGPGISKTIRIGLMCRNSLVIRY